MDRDKTTIEEVVIEVDSLKRQVESFKAVDKKIDGLSKLLLDVKDGINASHHTITRHELLLDEIRVNADFRKRESENSVREIKTQMVGMEHEIDVKTTVGVDKNLDRLDGFEKSQREEIAKLTQYFTIEIDNLKKRVSSIEKWNTFNIMIVLIVIFLVTLFP